MATGYRSTFLFVLLTQLFWSLFLHVSVVEANCYCDPCTFTALKKQADTCKDPNQCKRKKYCRHGCLFKTLTKEKWTEKCRCITGWAGPKCERNIVTFPPPISPYSSNSTMQSIHAIISTVSPRGNTNLYISN